MKKTLLAVALLAAGCMATPRRLARTPDDRVYQLRPRGSSWQARDEGGQTYDLQSIDLRAMPGVDEHVLGAKQVAGWTWVAGRVRPFPSWHGKGPGFVLSVTELLPGPPATVAAAATPSPNETPDALVVPAAVAESGGALHTWKVAPNGKACFVAPCPSWTATSQDGSGLSVDVIDVALSALGLDPQKALAMKKDVLRGATPVRGVILAVGTNGRASVLVVQP